MSEMLGNQYFMARKFAASVPEFEEVLNKTPDNKMIRKKLIICYTQIGQIQRAFQLFHSLIKEDIDIIAKTDVIADDCPCPELVEKFAEAQVSDSDLEKELKLGILWLYCNSNNSLEHFIKAQRSNPDDELLTSTIQIISSYQSNNISTQVSN